MEEVEPKYGKGLLVYLSIIATLNFIALVVIVAFLIFAGVKVSHSVTNLNNNLDSKVNTLNAQFDTVNKNLNNINTTLQKAQSTSIAIP